MASWRCDCLTRFLQCANAPSGSTALHCLRHSCRRVARLRMCRTCRASAKPSTEPGVPLVAWARKRLYSRMALLAWSSYYGGKPCFIPGERSPRILASTGSWEVLTVSQGVLNPDMANHPPPNPSADIRITFNTFMAIPLPVRFLSHS